MDDDILAVLIYPAADDGMIGLKIFVWNSICAAALVGCDVIQNLPKINKIVPHFWIALLVAGLFIQCVIHINHGCSIGNTLGYYFVIMTQGEQVNCKGTQQGKAGCHGPPNLPMKLLLPMNFGFFHHVVINFSQDFKEIFFSHNSKPLSVKYAFNCFRVRSNVLDTVPWNMP